MNEFNKKGLIWGIVIVLIIVGLITVSNKNRKLTGEPIKIVALFPLTGGLSAYGESAQRSAQIAVDDVNKNGGINGQPLIVDFQDHKCDPKTALSIFQQSAEKVKIFTSAACSGTVLSIAPNLETNSALLLGTVVTTPKISGISPLVFRNWASDAKETSIFAKVIKNRGYKKIGVIYEETDYAKGLKLSLENYLKDSGVQIISESFVTGSNDVRTQISKIKSAGVEAVFVSPQTVTSGEVILSQMEQLGFKVPLIVSDNILKAPDLITKHTGLLNGAIGADYVVADNQRLDKFLSDFKQKYGAECTQVNICAGAYDAIRMLAQGIAKNGYTAEGVRSYLKTINYQGISNNISFDENNDRANSEYSLFEIKDGEANRAR